MRFLCRQLLAGLLKSARPEDLETANRLIKSTIKEVRVAAVVIRSSLQRMHLKLCESGIHLYVCVCFLGAGEGGESVKARIYSKGGVEQHQRAQRTTGPEHSRRNLVRAE